MHFHTSQHIVGETNQETYHGLLLRLQEFC